MKEVWKDIPGFEGYQISNQGRVQSCRYGTRYGVRFNKYRLITPSFDGRRKYLMIDLVGRDGLRKGNMLARMVYSTFKGPIPEGKDIDHKDRNPLNNNLTNLRIASRAENVANCKGRNKFGYPKGIKRTKAGNWEARTTRMGKGVYLGTHPTQEEAVAAFSAYVKKTYGEFALVEEAKEIH